MSRSVAIFGVLGLGAVAMVVAVLLADSSEVPPPPPESVKAATPAKKTNPPDEEWEEPQARKPPPDPRLGGTPVDEEPREAPPPTPQFKAQSDEDRRRLGDTAYAEMEKLWIRGRHPRAHPDAIAAMAQLVERYPDTNRAGCARYELAQHHLKNGRVLPSERLKAAEPLLKAARDRNASTRCESDVSAGHLAAFALATDVYRHSDRRLALSILDELSALPPTETDRLGKPLSAKAAFMKEHLPPGMENPDKSAPLPETPPK